MVTDSGAILCCPTCGLLQQTPTIEVGDRAACPRCRAIVYRRRSDSIDRTLAFAFAGLIMYLLANSFPLIVVKAFGVRAVDFVWTGVAAMWGAGFQSVAAVIFTLSIVLPLFKLLLLTWLSLVARGGRPVRGTRQVYKIYMVLTDWWTVDVFILACLVGLSRLAQLVDASVGLGLYAMAALMVLSLAASVSFDPRLLWKAQGSKR
ncbi:MAG: paraquat-inducible protein A [Alphaproteobacteria bacterium]|nr:paraquat-inducible protein A [Alphaproteobacteria bacterium]